MLWPHLIINRSEYLGWQRNVVVGRIADQKIVRARAAEPILSGPG